MMIKDFDIVSASISLHLRNYVILNKENERIQFRIQISKTVFSFKIQIFDCIKILEAIADKSISTCIRKTLVFRVLFY
mgnify:CR=1 FL=1